MFNYLGGFMEFKNLRIYTPSESWEEIVIINDKGWRRFACYLSGKFFDHYGIEIKGFNPTHFMQIELPNDNKEN